MLFAAGPHLAGAAEPIKIGALTASWGPTPVILGLRDGLRDLGYRENEQFVIGVRFTQGDPQALQAAARDLVQQGVAILFAAGEEGIEAAKAATTRIPIVFAGATRDPIGRGLVQSLVRPGGNITGVVDLGDELAGKRLEFFRELVPGLKRVLVPYAGNDPLSTLEAQTYRAPARQLGIVLVEKPVQDREEAQAAFTKIRRSEVQGILLSHSLTWNVPGFAIEAAARQGIPTMFPSAFYVQEGGLAAYGPDYYATGRQAARLVSKVIKGEKPGEIPVEANPKIEFTINLKVARKLGLQIPSHVLVRADRVFQ
jgi:putative ABC transport system substrate-binding protein